MIVITIKTKLTTKEACNQDNTTSSKTSYSIFLNGVCEETEKKHF